MSIRRPFADLVDLLEQLPAEDSVARTRLAAMVPTVNEVSRDDMAQMPAWLGAWQRTSAPKLAENHICLFVSSYADYSGSESLIGFVENAGKGGVPVGKLCKERGVGLRLLEMAVELPHVVSNKWPEKDCMAATAFGMEATAAGGDILGLAALAPGGDEHCQALCQNLIDNLINKNQGATVKPDSDTLIFDLLNLMKNKAGREVAAMVGAMIAARSRSLPVLIEGWSGLAALSILSAIDRSSVDHVKVASIENDAQANAVDLLGMQPIVGPAVNLGVGCGIALALSTIAPMLNLLD